MLKIVSRSRTLAVIVIVVVLTTVYLLYFKLNTLGYSSKKLLESVHIDSFNKESWVVVPPTETSNSLYDFACPKSVDWLNKLRLNYPLSYARRDIIVKPIHGVERQSVTILKEALLPDFQTIIDPTVVRTDSAFCKAPQILEVPSSTHGYVDASHVIFGVSTSLQLLEDLIPYFHRWLALTKGRLLVQVVGPEDSLADEIEMKRLETLMNGLGICTSIVRPEDKRDNMPERYFSLVRLALEHQNEDTRWIGFFDDDTFVASLPKLLDMLSKHDDRKLQYLGALSEEWWTVGRYGLMGLGGAGVFLSLPMVQLLSKNYRSCKERSGAGAGDIRIFECIKWHTNTKLTHIPGLHQIDLHGDRSGLFESGRQLLTIHHWKGGWWDESGRGLASNGAISWFPLASMHLVTDICDTCFLQRWQFGSDLVLSNGFSIATYPTGALWKFPKDMGLNRVEHTWMTPATIEGSHNEGFDHYLGPLRPKLELEKEKVQYRFLDAMAEDMGVRQWYLRPGNQTEGRMDELVELFWTRDEMLKSKKVP